MITENEDIINIIQLDGTTITMLGTAHVSKESVALVEEKIMSRDFDCVAVELCPARYENLKNHSWWQNLDIYEVFKKKKASLLLINLALSAYQKRLAHKVGVEAGQEMIRATELARENDIRLEVIDRDITFDTIVKKHGPFSRIFKPNNRPHIILNWVTVSTTPVIARFFLATHLLSTTCFQLVFTAITIISIALIY